MADNKAIQTVVLAGGIGSRLWPTSSGRSPKQFIPLIGSLSLFQRTAQRAQALTGKPVLIVGGKAHESAIIAQLREVDVQGRLLLEPVGRDSAPAVAAAAVRLLAEGRNEPAAFLPSDHHVADDGALFAALQKAAEVALDYRLVTLGLRPISPETAYGYVQPSQEGLSPARFVEKPCTEEAVNLVASGALWNSGILVARPSTLIAELRHHAPELLATVQAALCSDGSDRELGPTFRDAPNVSIDYALLEKSEHVWVLPAAFEWSDIGHWDAVAQVLGTSERSQNWVDANSSGCFVRAADGIVVATVGVQDLNIIAEPGAVLVAAKGSGALMRSVAAHASALEDKPRALDRSAVAFRDWLRFRALPVWATLGVEPDGGFTESLTAEGRQADVLRRARVQARQVFVLTHAGRLGWSGPWRKLATAGLDRFVETNRRSDGLYRSCVSRHGEAVDETAALYDQAFALLAFASAAASLTDSARWFDHAADLRTALDRLRHPALGWREVGDRPFQANAQMHLLEAALAWDALEPYSEWAVLAHELVELALTRFMASSGALQEFFDADWMPVSHGEGQLIEPGHQFEWAWLLDCWGRRNNNEQALVAAVRLAKVGAKGFSPQLGVLSDELDTELNPKSGRARLWPQTEWLRAGLRLARFSEGGAREVWLNQAALALHALQSYLTPDGLWRDKLTEHEFVDEPAPASSLYHIMGAYLELVESAELVGLSSDALTL